MPSPLGSHDPRRAGHGREALHVPYLGTGEPVMGYPDRKFLKAFARGSPSNAVGGSRSLLGLRDLAVPDRPLGPAGVRDGHGPTSRHPRGLPRSPRQFRGSVLRLHGSNGVPVGDRKGWNTPTERPFFLRIHTVSRGDARSLIRRVRSDVREGTLLTLCGETRVRTGDSVLVGFLWG
jgi:hypothetical protein